jgi:hypothetical protein
MSMICKKCGYFKTKQGNGKKGECHRYPPVEGVRTDKGVKQFPTWPDVKPTQWCGEFRPKTAADYYRGKDSKPCCTGNY